MPNGLPGSVPPADGSPSRPMGAQPGRLLIVPMLLVAAILDLARCGIALATARQAGPVTGLVLAGVAAATLSLWAVRGCLGGRRWSAWAALLIGAASAPQAAATGFGLPYTVPDTATAALGVLLAVSVLATAGLAGRPGPSTAVSCTIRRQAADDPRPPGRRRLE
jgi:hypothetical protein